MTFIDSLAIIGVLAILILMLELRDIKQKYNMSFKDYWWCVRNDICPIHIWPRRTGICRFCQMNKHVLRDTEKMNEWEAFDNRLEEMKEKYGRNN